MNQASELRRDRRPGGRTAQITARIRAAVIDRLAEGGAQACTFKAVAEQAEVERSTLYRRFEDNWDMIVDAVMTLAEEEVGPELGNSFAEDLTLLLRKMVAFLEGPLGPVILAAATALRAHAGRDFSRAFYDRRMSQLEPMFEAAIQRGELPSNVDREAVFAAAAGPVYFRIFIAGRGVNEDHLKRIVSSVCMLYCTPEAVNPPPLSARVA